MIYVVFRPQMILCEIFGPYLCCIQYCIFVLYFLKQSRSIAIWELSTIPQFFKRETVLGRFFIWGSLGFKRYLTDPLDRLDSSVLTFGQLDIYCLSKNACKCLKMLKANRSLRVTGNKSPRANKILACHLFLAIEIYELTSHAYGQAWWPNKNVNKHIGPLVFVRPSGHILFNICRFILYKTKYCQP